MGVISYVLLSGTYPFGSGTQEERLRKIRDGVYDMNPSRWEKVSGDGVEFVRKLLEVDQDARLSAKQALAHPWIRERAKHRGTPMDANTVQALVQFAKASKFKRACMGMMALSLSVEDRDHVRQIFLDADR